MSDVTSLPKMHLPGSRTSFWEVMQSTCTFRGGAGPICPRAYKWGVSVDLPGG
jgi:hypothetical protein